MILVAYTLLSRLFAVSWHSRLCEYAYNTAMRVRPTGFIFDRTHKHE